MEMLLTGDPISAGRALELHLINQVVGPGRALEAALDLAGRICANAPLAVQASKRIAAGIIDGSVAADSELWSLSRAEGKALMKSRDAREGPRAFAEKRAPVWEAR
jgi:crotonobetainyl-CoA hydratase